MLRPALVSLVACAALCACAATSEHRKASRPVGADDSQSDAKTMLVQYLEIVTPDVAGTCSALEAMHGVRFSAPVAELGQARTAALAGGGKLGVRAPLSPGERTVVRPYVLVKDIEAAVAAASAAGAEIAHPPLEIPGEGTFAIYFLGGIEHGLWQL